MKRAEVKLKNGKSFSLFLPESYTLSVVAEGFRKPRFMAKSPDGRLFIGEMFNASDTKQGRILILDGFDAGKNTFTKTSVYLDDLRNPNSVAFYRDPNGQEWFYVALTDRLIRYKYSNGDLVPQGAPEVLTRFPDSGRDWAHGGWHLTRTLAFHGEKLYVSVGSSCNSCEEKSEEPSRGSILEMNPDGTGVRVYANGLRNAVGIGFVGSRLFATNNGPDHLGNDRPEDMFYQIEADKNYGWPYCYELKGQLFSDTTQVWNKQVDCTQIPYAFAALPPHSAPLGFDFFQDRFLIALHGSGNKAIATGYEVVAISPTQKDKEGRPLMTEFLEGFFQNGVVQGRPAGILTNNTRSFYLTDDLNGAVYLIEQKEH